ncbi:hypothetical protein SAMD00023378_3931 [Ralstonia sp. NT80]|uniref:hypothetical protein n=1 Tax=Ralstonia sp. NT80 TaxID=1218247 RepID=UPI00073E5C75|nr:hypothetical protein [Ralstonia sp. NT80]GAQ30248.1 hypothetical protein SAMD00023378_3931 [Ralstonia sp. NT80]
MLTHSPVRNEDLRHVDSGLPDCEKRVIHERARQIAALGRKWLLHPDNAPKRGTYNHNGTRIA